jgi:hypothetical protein
MTQDCPAPTVPTVADVDRLIAERETEIAVIRPEIRTPKKQRKFSEQIHGTKPESCDAN